MLWAIGVLGVFLILGAVGLSASSATNSQRYSKYQKSTKSNETQNPKKDAKKDLAKESNNAKNDTKSNEAKSAKSTKDSKDSQNAQNHKDKDSKKSQNPPKQDSANDEKLIDYSTLSLYYYPYIMAYHKITDKEIASLVKDLDLARKKTGVFLGIYGGWIFHNAAGNKDYELGNFLSYGAKVGFQSFYPTLFDSISFPNKVGGRIYLQYLGSNAKELNLASLGFSAIGVSGDLMIDLPVLPLTNGLEAGIIAGFGLASMIYDSSSDSRLGGIINIGTSFTLLSKHRIEGEIKLIINESLDWFGVMPMVGYSYVF